MPSSSKTGRKFQNRLLMFYEFFEKLFLHVNVAFSSVLLCIVSLLQCFYYTRMNAKK